MMVPNLATHQANAEEWIDYYYEPEVAAKLAAWVNYICPVKGAQEEMEKIDPSLVDNKLIFPDDEMLVDDVRLHAARRPADRPSTKETGPMSQVAESAPPSSRTTTTYDGLRLRGVTKSFGAFTAVARPRPRHPAGLVLRPARPVGLRQDDDPADGRRARDADRPGRSRWPARTSPTRKPYRRPVNTVFQNYALFPHLDIYENVAFGLKRRKVAGHRREGPRDARPGRARQPGAQAARPSSPAASSSASRWPGR